MGALRKLSTANMAEADLRPLNTLTTEPMVAEESSDAGSSGNDLLFDNDQSPPAKKLNDQMNLLSKLESQRIAFLNSSNGKLNAADLESELRELER